jgi:hypothetical protein
VGLFVASFEMLDVLSAPRRMLDDLEAGVDRTDNKLNSAMSRMKRFVRQTEGKPHPPLLFHSFLFPPY